MSFFEVLLENIIIYNKRFFGIDSLNNEQNFKFLITSIIIGFSFFIIKNKFKFKKIKKIFFANLFSHKFKSNLNFDLKFFSLKFIWKTFFFITLGYSFFGFEKNIIQFLNLGLDHNLPIYKISTFRQNLIFSVIMVIYYDFIFYCFHYLTHKIDFLWAFHKVHHASTYINPLTKYRVHPMEYLLQKAFKNIIFAGTFISIASFYNIEFTDKAVYFGLITALLYNSVLHLRHTKVWLCYGRLSYIFISPAQHQIHHSKLKRHQDKNFGGLFAVWDYIFGSHYYPLKKESFPMGIKEKGYDTSVIFSLYQPFIDCYRSLILCFYEGAKIKKLEIKKDIYSGQKKKKAV